jgi:hypothetical protein
MPAVLVVLAIVELVFGFIAYACCAIAGRADRAMGLK